MNVVQESRNDSQECYYTMRCIDHLINDVLLLIIIVRAVTKLVKSLPYKQLVVLLPGKCLPKKNDVTCSNCLVTSSVTVCCSYCCKGQKRVLAVDKQRPEVFLYGLLEEWRP